MALLVRYHRLDLSFVSRIFLEASRWRSGVPYWNPIHQHLAFQTVYSVMKLFLIHLLALCSCATSNTPWGTRHKSLTSKASLISAKSTAAVAAAELPKHHSLASSTALIPRGGNTAVGGTLPFPQTGSLDLIVKLSFQLLTTFCRIALPIMVTTTRAVAAFYSRLPTDLVKAQAGLAYCFAGGYFPTLFAALQAAQHCGWKPMVRAVNDLAGEAMQAVQACKHTVAATSREIFMANTKVVMSTIDPIKINQAVAALYTTWMGVSSVLEKEFARTIALAITIGDYIRPITDFVIAPPAFKCVPQKYHKWVPVVIGWGCKGAAMSIAWRIQRVLSAYSSAMAGGLMFARSSFRMMRSMGHRVFKWVPEGQDSTSFLDEVFGYAMAALGLYSQIGNGFDFAIPFPLNLISWPFELAEKWIQWQITKDQKA